MFDKLVWLEDRMLLDDLVFRIEHYKNENWELGDECFRLYKIKPLVDQYAKLSSCKKPFKAENIFEIGIWDGGSIALWFQEFQPKKHVAIDFSSRGDSDYFQRYIAARGLETRIKTYWGIDQADSAKLREIVLNEFTGSLDLVLDDASHLYEPTKASFEALFPLLRPGGFYIIEDWAWAYWKDCQAPDHPYFGSQVEMTKLIFELVELTGSCRALISSLTICEGFVVVERGELNASDLGDFDILKHISRRPRSSRFKRVIKRFIY
jgi:hypothetical protein